MKAKTEIKNPAQKFPYLAEDSKSKNVYIVFGGEKSCCDVMCIKVVHGTHWEMLERRNMANGPRLVDLPKGAMVELTFVQE